MTEPPPADAAEASDSDGQPKLTPDQKAAHQFLAELRTRIAIQPLPYRDGLETAALESLHSLFGASREAIKKYPGCAEFARTVTNALNRDLRPTTARWHRGLAEGRLASRDGGDAFRAELTEIRDKLVELARTLHWMAYETPFADIEVRAEIDGPELAELMQPLRFDFLAPLAVGRHLPAEIAPAEAQAVALRRDNEKAAEAARRDEKRKAEAEHRAQEAKAGAAPGPVEPEPPPDYVPPEGCDAVGLALSGGGIRSATFCLGVVQALADRELLGQVDFLSTVSGGGFTGAFLTRRLGKANKHTDLAQEVGGSLGPDPKPVRYVRRFAKYLMVEHLSARWRMATAALAGLLLNWTPLLSVLALFAACYLQLDRDAVANAVFNKTVLTVCALLCLTTLALYGVAMRLRLRLVGEFGGAFGWALGLSLALSLAWGLRELHPAIVCFFNTPAFKWPSIGFGAIVAAIPTLLRFVPVAKAPATRDRILKLVLALAVFVVPAALLLGFHALLEIDKQQIVKDLWGASRLDKSWALGWINAPGALVVALLSGLVALFGLNVNLTGPHRLYRDRIAETFVISDDLKHPYAPLGQIGGGRAPYHLINTAVNLPSETEPALRARKCDFFVFSKLYCGSPSTGYAPTADWSTDGRALDLATAVAISGAAVAPNMGLSSYPTLRAMLTLLNVRLSFWLWQPKKRKSPHAKPRASRRAPGFLCLIREMTGWGMKADSRWHCLSDGGHIENLGLYELLRRRCKFIICVDAEQDGDYRFGGLTTVIRQAQIDFGIRIAPDLGELKPNPATGLSRAHFAFCRIVYPDKRPPGFLLYLKPSLTGDEDEMLKRFKLAHPSFPHHPTLDQFFDEECFEMYRRLGAHVAAGLFGAAITRGRTAPATVAKWFETLAVSLLEPRGAPARSHSPPLGEAADCS